MLRQSFAIATTLAAAACALVPESDAPAIAGVAPGQLSEATMKEVTRTLSLDEFDADERGETDQR